MFAYAHVTIVGVYDDPWNVEQVQQEIFEQLERQKQKTITSDGRHRRPSEEVAVEKTKKADIFATPMQVMR